MIPVSKILENLKNEVAESAKIINYKKISVSITAEEYRELFFLLAEKEMLKKSIKREFIIDQKNKEIINQLYNYLICSEKFKGEHRKGILIIGAIGVGKTLILTIICNMIEMLSNKVIERVHSKKIIEAVRTHNLGYFDKRPLFIDDLGREAKEINNYGTKELPLIDLLSIRYDNGSLTFATSNFDFKKLTEFYGLAITDRMKEMFNIIEYTGESKRI